MARHAKDVAPELKDAEVKKRVVEILAHYENIETARGKFMNSARREREGMTAIYEALAQQGVSQKSAKTEIKIVRAIERIKGWMSDLEEEDRRMVQKLAKAQGDKRQLSLFLDTEEEGRQPRRRKAKAAPQAAAEDMGAAVGSA
jgi:hypothetical protein